MIRYNAVKFAVLSALLLTSLSACGDTGHSAETSAPPTVSSDETTGEASSLPALSLPEGLDFNGREIRILEYENLYAGATLEDFVEGRSDYLVKEAIYQRNLRIAELLNVSFTSTEVAYAEIDGLLKSSIMAGSNDYDIVANVASRSLNAVNNRYYHPLSDLKYIDLSKPWWFSDYIDALSLNRNSACILFGDICYNCTDRVTATFFNKRLLSEYKGLTDNDLYQTVLDGKWTLDYLTELCRDVYYDVNGNGVNDGSDIVPLTEHTASTVDYLAYSAGLTFTSRDEKGYPTLSMNNERSVGLVEKLLSLFASEGIFSTDSSNESVGKFANGQSLFLANRLYAGSWDEMRVMKDDYGILPMPKYDETIDNYHSVTGNMVVWGGVPITNEDTDCISAVCEAMAYYGNTDVFPIYYETALKQKYTRDDISSQMIDIIKENCRTDFLYLNDLAGLGKVFSNIVRSGENTFASSYAGYETAAAAQLKSLIEADSQNQ